MAGEVQDDIWPLPKFYFSVQLGDDSPVTFQEVSGLESEVIEYQQDNNSPGSSPVETPDLGRAGNVTMRKGIFVNDQRFWNWHNEIKSNTIKRQTMIVNLLDEIGTPKMSWTLNNAQPTQITGTDLTSEGNEVAVESVEVAYETLVVSAP